MKIGDAVLSFTAETEQLDKTMNALFDRAERTVKAAREAWNCRPVALETMLVALKGGGLGAIRVYRDDLGNYRDCFTKEVVTGVVAPTP